MERPEKRLSEEPLRIQRMFNTLLFLTKCPNAKKMRGIKREVGCGECFQCQAFRILTGDMEYPVGRGKPKA